MHVAQVLMNQPNIFMIHLYVVSITDHPIGLCNLYGQLHRIRALGH